MNRQLILTQPIAKPDLAIPDDEWQNYSPANQAFAEFIYEVFDYFSLVINEKLKWQVEDVKVNQGSNNLVIRFTYRQEIYLFRVPKFGQSQLKNYMRASRLVSHHHFFPECIYIDGRCMIERFVVGNQLTSASTITAYIKLAQCLSQLHSQEGKGYGLLLMANQGASLNIADYYLATSATYWESLAPLFQDQQPAYQALTLLWQQKLTAVNASSTSSPVVCHGDLWQANLIYNEEHGQLKLIDWDTCGIYHREKDLHFLLDEKISPACKQAFFEHYPHPVDDQLMAWFRLTIKGLYFIEPHLNQRITAMNHFLKVMGSNEKFNAEQVQE
ncbi:MAG: aminoglycoside phosphotransferase family protein [Pseudomonadaceae bacterium]|nr:aminoglycoside phosphotransferase family protein [Pseudomonadaceae bacterium]